jgi:hypothetical protein
MDLHSKKTMFTFKQNADDIPYEELHFDRYVEFSDNLAKPELIDFIMNEVGQFQRERIEDVSSLKTRHLSSAPSAILTFYSILQLNEMEREY